MSTSEKQQQTKNKKTNGVRWWKWPLENASKNSEQTNPSAILLTGKLMLNEL